MSARLAALCGATTLAVCVGASAQGGSPVNMMERAFGRVAPVATAQRDASVPAGTIRVAVVDEQDQPLPEAVVELGIMEQGGARERKECLTDAGGSCTFDALPTGESQSYRVNVPYEGAKYSTTPFRLDPTQGHVARIRRLPTTTDDQRVLQLLGRTMMEFKDDRIRVTQESRLANVGQSTYVFPKEGKLVRLPEGFLVFDSRAIMSDQRIIADDEGLRLFGSVPPGPVSLSWWYEIPVKGSRFELVQPVSFRTVEYDVLADHVPGITFEVEGFAPARIFDHRGRQIAVTKLSRKPADPPLTEVHVLMAGIPTGRTMPLVAVVLASLLVLLGVTLTVRRGDPTVVLERARSARRTELLQEAKRLEQDFARSEVGPKYHARRKQELVDELAALLRFDAEL